MKGEVRMDTIRGKAWIFGDAIDTDIIIPARHLVLPMDEMKHKAMEPLRPTFPQEVTPGDVIIAGRNFGCGSSREQAPAVLKELGISAIVAVSFARIFFRNAINLGIPVVECAGVYEHVQEGDQVEIQLSSGMIRIPERDMEFMGSSLPDFLLAVVNDGGLIRHLAAKRGMADRGGDHSSDRDAE
jgi:3-isopropylmalate/(R)-2-methylmalate dehydratase small subunit